MIKAIAASVSIVALLSAPVRAQDIKVFDAPPTADELREALGVTNKPGVRTRSIQIDGPSAPTTPATPASTEPAPAPASHRPAPATATRPRPATSPAATTSTADKTTGKPVAMRIQFDVGSASLRPGAEAFIESIAKVLAEAKQYSLTIEGHTDASGQFARNLSLSMARAAAVRDVLVQKYGIDGARLTAVGKGPSQPLNPGNPFDPANRRVQFELKS